MSSVETERKTLADEAEEWAETLRKEGIDDVADALEAVAARKRGDDR